MLDARERHSGESQRTRTPVFWYSAWRASLKCLARELRESFGVTYKVRRLGGASKPNADSLVNTSGYQNLKNYIAEDDGKKAGVVVTMQDKYDRNLAQQLRASLRLSNDSD